MSSSYNLLLNKIDSFIRRYYYHLLIKGILVFLAGTGILFLFFSFIEYFGYFNSVTRAVLLFGFYLFSLIVFLFFVLRPVAGLFKIGKRVTLEDAAKILGKHFKHQIDDKILNTLQLKNYLAKNSENEDLILAGIEQKSKGLIHFPFYKAVDLKKNWKYVPYVAGIVAIIAIGWIYFPYLLKEPAQRIVRYTEHFERPAPFSIVILNDLPLQGIRNERFRFEVKTQGDIIPEHLDIVINNLTYRMGKDNRNQFNYEFRSLGEPVRFYLRSGNFIFGPYQIELISRAVIKNFNLQAKYPSYTRLPDESFINAGDLRVPEGTVLTWDVFTEDTEELLFTIDDALVSADLQRTNVFQHSIRAKNSFRYSISAMNDVKIKGDSLHYSIRTVADQYPSISMEEYQDSIMLAHLFFRGLIRDDYGFSDLGFYHRIISNNQRSASNDQVEFNKVAIAFEEFNLNQSFYFHWDLQAINIKPGESFEYFFEVADNDGINGPKRTRSRVYSISIPSHQELIAESIASDEEVKSGLSESISEINSIQDEIDQLRRSMLESENITWEQQETLRNLLDKQQKAQENYEQLKQFAEDKSVKEQQFREQDETILKKQEELQRLFEEVLTDEMKDLYEQIQQELEKMNRESVFEMLERMEFEMQDLENRLDRALELFKQLQVERMLDESIKFLERIKEGQEELKENIDQTGIDENTAGDQEDINKEFEDLQDLLDEMMKRNEELSRPNRMDDTGELQKSIMQDLMRALNSIQEGDSGEAGDSQEGAMQKMDELGNSLSSMLSAMRQENLAEDIRTIREILDNLIKTSFAQEDLMEETRAINTRDPRYVNLIQQQRKISNDLVMIKDSLNALAKRQIQIESYVTREIAMINLNIDHAIDQLINRRKHTGISRQQFVMTHVNNLALLLNESMQNMQNQMQAQGEGDPDSGQEGMPGFQDLRQMQEQMNQMLEQLREGHQPMPGESGESSMSLSEQLARMAAEQEAIRNRLNELTRDMRGDGEDVSELDQLMREMERTEMDILTNNISRQTQLRQQRILTRLLEHERAELEREQEERRVGETANFYDLSNPEDFFEYNRKKNRAMDMLRSMPPGFRPHYKSLVEIYFLNVQE